jgi:hypothetical protein
MVEAEATKPTKSFGAPRLVAKGFKTGFLDIVELRRANRPIMQIIENRFFSGFFISDISCKPIPAMITANFHLAR